MARHEKLDGLMSDAEALVRIAANAQDTANRALTRRSGTIVVQNEDGSKTVIGPGAGTDATGLPTGVAEWVGDTTVPGVPTGISASSSGGVVVVTWDGTLDGGVPADFAYIRVTATDGATSTVVGDLTGAGSVSTADYPDRTELTVTAVSYDAARDLDGNFARNESDPSSPVSVTVTDAGERTQWYFWHDSEGAHVSSSKNPETGDVTGSNILITGESVKIRIGAETIASFNRTQLNIGTEGGSLSQVQFGNIGGIYADEKSDSMKIYSYPDIYFTNKPPGTTGSSSSRVGFFELVDRVTALESPKTVTLTPNTGLLNYSNYANSSVYLGNGVVLLQCAIILDSSTDWNSDELTLFTITDADMRPSDERYLPRMCTAFCSQGANSYARGIRVYPNGQVRFQNPSGGTDAVNNVVIAGVAYRL